MKFTLSWLRAHLETDAPLDTVAERLTALGLEVEGIEDKAAALAPFTVGYVTQCERHPNADKLQVCMVETGQGEPFQVVCGAPNARAGMKGVFAPVGASIPGAGIVLKKGVIRGVESNGMLCSEREMGLSEEHEGIIELPEDAPVGASFASVMGLDDPVIDIALTPDRGDCAGVHGIARDLAASGLGRLRPLPTEPVAGAFESPIGVRFAFSAEESRACPLFAGRVIRNVKNGPSPEWLQERLRAIGLRPISALVDVTNYFAIDRCRPLHVFDADKVRGDLTLRPAREGENLEALNERAYALPEGATVIADESGPISLGGVMGGASTACTEETTAVFLEVALFDPIRTAETGRLLGIDSDARYRFERGVDPEAVFDSLDQATAMILELCGGEASETVFAGAVPEWRRRISYRPARVASLGGLDIPPARQRRHLEALGCAVEEAGEGRFTVTPPSWRPDLEGEADLVEEALRLEGYDAIAPVSMPPLDAVPKAAVTPSLSRAVQARRTLAARGMVEAITWSFMEGGLAAKFGFADEGLRLLNPIASDLDVMRPTALANLVQAAVRNEARGLENAALFEVGPAWRDASEDGQERIAAGVRTGETGPRHWAQAPREVDAFDAKADALAVLEALGAPLANLQVTADAPAWFHPGRSGCLRLGANVLARFGELHPTVLATLDADFPVAAFEVMLDALPQPKRKQGTARPRLTLSAFQPVTRDFAFIVANDVTAERVLRAARSADRKLIVDAAVFDLYVGKGVPEGRKSLAIQVTLQPQEATLTEDAIEAVAKRVVEQVSRQTGAELRG